ncbi:odorant receptor 4 [Orussus abietinus]|uniref:odorant receptor 4 n=1 Tax=Orussus abietinus TaxID=222816 RepID=UPI000625AFAE|nr:odorant receptor 4 [Orussus abietinus]
MTGAMVDHDVAKYRKFSRNLAWILYLTGLWSNEKSLGIFYRFVRVIVGLIFFLMGLVILNFCHFHRSNLSLMLKGLSLFLSTVLIVLKIVCFTVNRTCLVDLYKDLGKVYDQDLEDETLRPYLLADLTLTTRSFRISALMVFGTLSSYVVPAVAFMYYQSRNHINPVKYVLPFPGVYPWPIETTTIYIPHFLFELFVAVGIFTTTVGVDSTFILFAMQICGETRTLAYQFRQFSFAEDQRLALKKCLARHLLLLRSRNNLQTLFGPIVFFLFLSSAVIMCVLVFQLVQTVNLSLGKSILFALYFIVKIQQALAYAWAGTLFTSESNGLLDSLYSSQWTDITDLRIRKSILIILGQKPMILRGSGFFDVSVNTFLSMLQTAVSYFFLLQTLEGKDEECKL